MKIFKILLILALGLQVGLFGAEGETSSSGNDGENYLKYQSNAIVNDGECYRCDEVKDGYIAFFDRFDDITGTTYCKVYKNTDWNNAIGYANKTVKSCSLLHSKETEEAN